jgi:hypothetical protein
MKKNFEIRLVGGYTTEMNNVNEVAQFVKNELLTNNYMVKVNEFEFRLTGGHDGYDGYVLEVGITNKGKLYVHMLYGLGKIRRGIGRYVEDFLVLNTEYGVYNTPKYVWENGELISYKAEVNEENEVVEENEYDVVENLVEGFNEKIENIIDGIWNETCENAVFNAEICNDTENEYVCATMDWDIDIESIWLDYVEQWAGDEYLDVAERYYNDWENRRIYDEDGICEYVGNAYGDYIEDNCCGSCLVYVKNPYYVAEDSPKNDAPCLDEDDIDRGIERVVDTIEKYLGSYIPSYLDKFGDCVITIYWDEFDEEDMKMLIEDDIFAISVRDTLYEKGIIVGLSGFLVYDDGVYVTVDYDRMFNKIA